MKKVPFETIIWHILPAIRKEFTIRLTEKYQLNRKEIAELLGITEAAICQYLLDKRGHYQFTDEDLLSEIEKSTNIIFHNGSESLITETCRLCSLIKSKGIVEKIEEEFNQIPFKSR